MLEIAKELRTSITAVYMERSKRGIKLWQFRLVPDSGQPSDHKLIRCKEGELAKVDNEDYDSLKQHCWYIGQGGYAYTRIDTKLRRMHKLLLNGTIDHINGDPIDNRKSNLRVATQAQNCRNQRKQTRGTTSRYKGVSHISRNPKKPWSSHISLDGHAWHIGYFQTEEEAARAYDAWAVRLHKEFARLNFPS